MTALTALSAPVLSRAAIRQVASFGAIGVVSTLAYVLLYAALRNGITAGVANVVALLVTAVGNTAANRRLTFEVRGRDGLVRHHAAGLLALGVALLITSGSLVLLGFFASRPSRLTEIVVLVAANAAATLARFLLLRLAIERSRVVRTPGWIGRAPAVRAPIAPAHGTLSPRERILR